jgi:hypothetical protein
MQLTIEWPSLLNGATPLQLVTFGKVVRSSQGGFAVAVESYQFRTMKRNLQPLSTALGVFASRGMIRTDKFQKAPASVIGRDQSLEPAALIAKPSS